jgi:hypothetical protein
MNPWVAFVKEYSKNNNISYGCAISKPECKEQYYKKKDFSKNKSKQHKENITALSSKLNKKIVENQLVESMGMKQEDINVDIPKESKVKSKRGRPVKYSSVEEKKAMKLQQTLRSNKKKREERKIKMVVI